MLGAVTHPNAVNNYITMRKYSNYCGKGKLKTLKSQRAGCVHKDRNLVGENLCLFVWMFLNIHTNILNNSSRRMLAIMKSGLFPKNPDSMEDCFNNMEKKVQVFLAGRGKLIKEHKSTISREQERKEH